MSTVTKKLKRGWKVKGNMKKKKKRTSQFTHCKCLKTRTIAVATRRHLCAQIMVSKHHLPLKWIPSHGSSCRDWLLEFLSSCVLAVSVAAAREFGVMSHTILLVQPTRGQKAKLMLTKSVNECMEGICEMYEDQLKRVTPNSPYHIWYQSVV